MTGLCRRCVMLMTLALAATVVSGAPPHEPMPTLRVQTDRPGARINAAMWGLFFEDINFGADGGLYAELVKNRSFEFPNPLMGWTPLHPAGVEIRQDAPLNDVNSHYVRVTANERPASGLVNEGFRGIGLHGGKAYEFSAWIRAAGGSPVLTVELVSGEGRVLAATRLKNFSPGWKQYFARLRPQQTDFKAQLRIQVQGPGALDLDMVSLFPRDTWKGRRGGLRADLVEMLAAMKPGFLRFPGGCIVEGRYLTNRYDWKTTLGAPETRKLIINRWNNEFRHRPAPDYYQSFGLGFFEYFQLCEDLGAEPMPILNCGMACQFNSGELAPLQELDSYIQDALDLIEFANGPASTRWGSQRAAMGHPAPFGMKLLGIGNEQWGPQYIERYARFARVLKQRHPEIQLISSAGPAPADDRFTFAWNKLRELKADIIDEHCYAAPKWFFDNVHRYDHYDRHGPKVFMGEYAAQSVAIASPDNRNTLECALAEAAYMTGMERNADVVRMASYAPLFGHAEAWQWTPNLIWCDNLRVYGTPNYYVQLLFSRNRGDVVLPLDLFDGNATGATPADRPRRLFASAVLDERSHEVILKVVNPSDQATPARILLAGCAKAGPVVHAHVLRGRSLNEQNSFEDPTRIAPVTQRQRINGPAFETTLPPYSFTVLRVRAR